MKRFLPFLLFPLLACDPAQNTDTSETTSNDPDFEVVAHIAAEPDGLHPTNNNSLNMAYIFESIHKRVYRTNMDTYEMNPELAAELPEQIDSVTYRIKLRTEAKWDDDSPLTAEDVRFTVLLSMHPLTKNNQKKGVFLALVDSIKVIDDKTFEYKTNYPFAGSNYLWTDIPIISKAFYDSSDILRNTSFQSIKAEVDTSESIVAYFQEFNSRKYSHDPEFIHGLGGYAVTDWQENDIITIERKENWWGEKIGSEYFATNPKKIHYKIITDEEPASIALNNKKIDVDFALSSSQAHDLEDDASFQSNYYLSKQPDFGYTFLSLNTIGEETGRAVCLSDSSARLALAFATPYKDIINSMYGMATRVTGLVSKNRSYYNHNLELRELDIEKANYILKNGGWKDENGDGIKEKIIDGKKVNLEFDLAFIKNVSYENLAKLISESFLEIGAKTNLVEMKGSEYGYFLVMRDYDALIGNIVPDAGFEDLGQLLHTREIQLTKMNFSGFGNSYSDSLLDKINRTANSQDRVVAYEELQRIFYEQNTMIVLYGSMRKIATSNRFKEPKTYADKPYILLHDLQLK